MAGSYTALRLCFFALVVAPFQVFANSNLTTLRDVGLASGSVTVNLLSYDHVNSPFSNPARSRSERILNAVQRSNQRYHFIAGSRRSVKLNNNSNKAYTSPASPLDDNGAYTMEITIGTPPRTFVVLADTGSDLLWINCRGCEDCDEQEDPLFDPAASSTYSRVSCLDPKCLENIDASSPCPVNGSGLCPYDISYADASESTGRFSKETITLLSTDGSNSSFPGFYFGCGYNLSGDFGDADGLVGLGRGDLSLPSQLGPQINHTFSYCFVNYDSATRNASSLILGTTDGGNLTVSSTPLLPNIYHPDFYYVSVTGFTIGGERLIYPEDSLALTEVGDGGIIVDSGTTLTYLATEAYEPFLQSVQKKISYPLVFSRFSSFDLCYNISGIRKPTYPTVVVHLKGLDVTLPNENLFMVVDDLGETVGEAGGETGGEIVCLALGDSPTGLFGPGISIIGNIWQQNLRMTFDLANNKLGIRPTQC